MSESIEMKLVRIEEQHHSFSADMQDILQRFFKHMDKEEIAFDKLYSRLRAMEKELADSFKERDNLINALKLQQTKMMAYATAAFSAMTILSQIAMKVVF